MPWRRGWGGRLAEHAAHAQEEERRRASTISASCSSTVHTNAGSGSTSGSSGSSSTKPSSSATTSLLRLVLVGGTKSHGERRSKSGCHHACHRLLGRQTAAEVEVGA